MKRKRVCLRNGTPELYQFLRTMKITLLFVLLSFTQLDASVWAQRVNIELKNASLREIFEQIKLQTGVSFMFSNEDVRHFQRKDFRMRDADVTAIMENCLAGTGLTYELSDNVVVVRKAVALPQVQKKVAIKGTVKDKSGEPLPGVAVLIKGTSLGVSTDVEGRFEISVPIVKDLVLVFTFVGMKPQEVVYKDQTEVHVVMEAQVTEMNEVVVTGIFSKAKESYTGAATTITSADLKRAGNRSLLTSIRNIDPSFNIMDNPDMGSDPNSLPDITVRGNSSMTANMKDLQTDSRNTQASNLPLFIMDGFEISLERMMDLDDNQVESITLLKDASATAMYGTRGANGVVVITTKQPEAGKLQLTYKGGINIEAPDLTSYDLLNAKEKLAYEKAAHLYTPYGTSTNQGIDYQEYQDLYNSRLKAAERGVNTYWLKYPVRTGVGHNHSLRLEGGREEIRYAVGLSYKNIAGAMKGSDRNTFNGNMFLSYKLKNVTFQNDLQIATNKSINSPYGKFSQYAELNSYWKPYDDDGNLLKILDDTRYTSLSSGHQDYLAYNPLYDAYLPSIDESKYMQIQNNFAIEWHILPELFVRGRLGITKQHNRSDVYKSASHTDYADYPEDMYELRGAYTMGWGESFKYEADFTLNYNKTLNQVHQLYAGLGYNFAQTESEDYEVTGRGIPDDNSDFLGLASMYDKGGKPKGSEGLSRRVGGILNLNYTYDRRYFVDVSGKMEGSSKFGSENRVAPFWSVGAGWNVHQEKFMEGNTIFNVARFRVSYGTSGSQNFDPYQAMRTFKYFGVENYHGFNGAYLLGLGNPELGWQKTKQLNVGVELELWRSRVKLNVDFYNKLTDDMLADITLPTASGFNTYKANVGQVLNRGIELSLNAYLVRNTESNIFWSVGGTLAHNKNEIQEISNSLEFLNESLTKEDGVNPSFLFKEGQSMNTIFAVKSLGIDPSNGKEIFVKADGTQTYVWDAKDKVPCGVSDPKIWGNLNTMFRYKGWTLNAIFSYRWGGQRYNTTLANKVENNDPIRNADRRVLYDRWKTPGDRVMFKSVRDFSTTNATTRFIADENTLECTSVSLGYDWESKWLQRHLSLSYLTITAYGEDIFRLSTIKQERGINYPYARKFSLSLTARF